MPSGFNCALYVLDMELVSWKCQWIYKLNHKHSLHSLSKWIGKTRLSTTQRLVVTMLVVHQNNTEITIELFPRPRNANKIDWGTRNSSLARSSKVFQKSRACDCRKGKTESWRAVLTKVMKPCPSTSSVSGNHRKNWVSAPQMQMISHSTFFPIEWHQRMSNEISGFDHCPVIICLFLELCYWFENRWWVMMKHSMTTQPGQCQYRSSGKSKVLSLCLNRKEPVASTHVMEANIYPSRCSIVVEIQLKSSVMQQNKLRKFPLK